MNALFIFISLAKTMWSKMEQKIVGLVNNDNDFEPYH